MAFPWDGTSCCRQHHIRQSSESSDISILRFHSTRYCAVGIQHSDGIFACLWLGMKLTRRQSDLGWQCSASLNFDSHIKQNLCLSYAVMQSGHSKASSDNVISDRSNCLLGVSSLTYTVLMIDLSIGQRNAILLLVSKCQLQAYSCRPCFMLRVDKWGRVWDIVIDSLLVSCWTTTTPAEKIRSN